MGGAAIVTDQTESPGEHGPARESKRYVVGFLLNDDRSQVVLIEKTHPDWQRGKWNGVGGKVEPTDKTSADAMAREFEEETGLRWPAHAWDPLCTISWPDDAVRVGDAKPTSVDFFRSVMHNATDLRPYVRSLTDERVVAWPMAGLSTAPLIPNLRWLLPLAAYTADRYEPFTLHATVAEAFAFGGVSRPDEPSS